MLPMHARPTTDVGAMPKRTSRRSAPADTATTDASMDNGSRVTTAVGNPLSIEASVVAVSAGADRRLVRLGIAPTSVVGRACIGNITVAAEGGEVFGTRRQNRRGREDRALAHFYVDTLSSTKHHEGTNPLGTIT